VSFSLRNSGYVVLYFKFSSCYTLGPESLLPNYHVEQPPVGRESAKPRIHSSHTIFKGCRPGIWDYGCRSHSGFSAFNRICYMESRLAATSEPCQLPTAGVRVDIKVSLIVGVLMTPVRVVVSSLIFGAGFIPVFSGPSAGCSFSAFFGVVRT
jgi:hypothetical protein